MGMSVSFEQFGTIVVKTFYPLFRSPKTGVLPAAPLPLLPPILLAPKYDSSNSYSPISAFASFMLSAKIIFLIRLKYLFTVFLLTLEMSAVWVADRSFLKHKICSTFAPR